MTTQAPGAHPNRPHWQKDLKAWSNAWDKRIGSRQPSLLESWRADRRHSLKLKQFLLKGKAMVTFPTPKPELERAEHPRGTPAWITDYPSQRQIDGKAPIDAPPTIESRGGTRALPGKEPMEPGLPAEPTAANTAGGAG